MVPLITLDAVRREYSAWELSFAATNWPIFLRNLLVAAMIGGCVVVAFEPDHTSDLPLLTAFGLWSSHLFFALAVFVAVLVLALRVGLPSPWPLGVAILLLPALFAPISLLLDVGFGKPDPELLSADGLMPAYLSEVVAVAPMAIATALTMSFALYKMSASPNRRSGGAEAKQSGSGLVLRDLIASLPGSLGNEIVRMHAQDHYVEVVTTEGRAVIMGRFSDCVKKLKQIDGMQCHRSHWINLNHVTGLHRTGSAYLCSLDNGDRVPVGRRRYAALKKRLSTDVLFERPRSFG